MRVARRGAISIAMVLRHAVGTATAPMMKSVTMVIIWLKNAIMETRVVGPVAQIAPLLPGFLITVAMAA